MAQSRKRKNRKKFIQIVPVQAKIPVGTELVDNPDKPGEKKTVTKVALVKLNKTRAIKHLPQKH